VDRSPGDIIPRNSPTVLNAHLLENLFHDGRIEINGADLATPAGSAFTTGMRAVFDPQWELLAAQAMFPLTSRQEMRGQNGQNPIANLGDSDFAGIWDGLRDRLVAFTAYQALFLAAYPGLAGIGDIEFEHAANAIGAFEVRAFGLTDSAFERFVGGDDQALTEQQVSGALAFYAPNSCARCHTGSSFTDNSFHNIGLPQFGPGKGDGGSGLDDFGRERVSGQGNDRYQFRTAPLLNIELTAPYGHLGQYDDLRSMVLHYTDTQQFLQNYSILNNVTDTSLTGTLLANTTDIRTRISNRVRNPRNFDVDAVVAFLQSLTADSARDLSALMPATVPSGLSLR
jgi:cytochrome c peroxidase